MPILLSVGYSACHWCHVMAHECFEDVEIADVMNELFVNVKVDREERPDVDAIYMDAVQAMTGRGGWPMTVFLTPDRRAVLRRHLLPQAAVPAAAGRDRRRVAHRPADVQQNVDGAGEALRPHARRRAGRRPARHRPGRTPRCAAGHPFDPEWGGFGARAEVPLHDEPRPAARAYRPAPGRRRAVLTTSLDAMASGGIYDHLGGGFARYSADAHGWCPTSRRCSTTRHCSSGSTRTAASASTERDRYRQVVEETIDYVLRDLRHPDGGFYSAEDADSPDEHGHGHEGLFHTWTVDEVARRCSAPTPTPALDWYEFTRPTATSRAARSLHGCTHRGELAAAAAHRGRPRRAVRGPRAAAAARARRQGAHRVERADAGGAGRGRGAVRARRLGDAAVANGEFLLRELRDPDGRWHRSWHADGAPPARHHALAADHAALVDAFTRLAELTGGPAGSTRPEVADTMLDHFWDLDRGGLFTTPDDGEHSSPGRRTCSTTPHRPPTPPPMGALPAGRAHRRTPLHEPGRPDPAAARRGRLAQHPTAVSNALAASRPATVGHRVVSSANTSSSPACRDLGCPTPCSPGATVRHTAVGRPPARPRVLCRDHACQRPTDDPSELFELISGRPLPDGSRDSRRLPGSGLTRPRPPATVDDLIGGPTRPR